MCGIAGQARADRAPVSEPLLESMCEALEHRGPDQRGTHVDAGIGLGIQRLRVIDLETGDQPIYNEDRSIAVVLNGEIYNFGELREQLIRAGHSFRTHGDTEVIVHLYEEKGADCVRSLHGMFAFALWDAKSRELLLARDRVGKKPLFYSHRDGVLSFASELRSLMRDPEIPRELDHNALDSYYAYQYVPSPMSVFKHVAKLPPASTLRWRDGKIVVERYWQLDYGRKRSGASSQELQEELRHHIRQAVKRRMIADVPLGAFLSGGIDSSAVVAAMAQQSSQPVKTFSIGFDEAAFNELDYARQVAQLYATDHHEFTVEPSAIELLPTIVRHYGEPFADSSAIPSFYLAELTRRHVTVALNGDGGDESFAGYNRYVAHNIAAQVQRFTPLWSRRLAGALGERMSANGNKRSVRSRAKRWARALALDGPTRYARSGYFDAWDRVKLYTPEYREQVSFSSTAEVIAGPWRRASGASIVDVMLEVDVTSYLPDDLLVKMDIATMAHSLEARSPLLDHELMEFAASVPADLKLHGLQRKILLRDAVRSWLPDEILDRKKMGFSVPLPVWFRGELRDYVTDMLLDPRTLGRGYFRESYIRWLIDRHVAGLDDCSPKLWALLVSECWHREFVDAPVQQPAVHA